jgi:catechol 2,3-dioxygenase-like lactoylglutathione lyase family enzyme
VRITGLDHIVLNTPDPERALAWYTGVLGLAGERVEEWRQGRAPFPSVRINEDTIVDLFRIGGAADGDGPGNLDHFCLVMPKLDWEEMLQAGAIPVVRGPSEVYGARGVGTSIYTRDPDGNTVELRRYDD